MNFRYIIMGAAAAALLFISSCKPSQSAYQEAYASTIEARNQAADDYPEGYIALPSNMKRSVAIVGKDTLQLTYVPVTILENGGGIRESLKPYSVVVGQFRQAFNARQMRERIAQRGYPGAFVVRNGEPRYYVIAASVPTLPEAAVALREVETDTANFRFHSPVPFILTRRR